MSITGTLTLGDLIVGAGTLLLALFTWRLARASYVLDKRSVDREHGRRERQVQGIARLVYGELEVVETTLALARQERKWHRGYPVPRGAWDRDGAIIAESLLEDEVQKLIDFFSELGVWLGAAGEVFAAQPGTDPIAVDEEQDARFAKMLVSLSDGRRYLHPHAYPQPPHAQTGV